MVIWFRNLGRHVQRLWYYNQTTFPHPKGVRNFYFVFHIFSAGIRDLRPPSPFITAPHIRSVRICVYPLIFIFNVYCSRGGGRCSGGGGEGSRAIISPTCCVIGCKVNHNHVLLSLLRLVWDERERTNGQFSRVNGVIDHKSALPDFFDEPAKWWARVVHNATVTFPLISNDKEKRKNLEILF